MLSSVDEVLAHAGVYDPLARRERYLRSRELKGRAPGQQQSPTGSPSGGKGSSGASVPVTQANAAASSIRQVAALKVRLASLKVALQKLLVDAESSSSSDLSSSSSTKSGGSSSKTEPTTAKQKAAAKEALKEAQKVRSKEALKNPEPKKTTEPTKEEKIAHLRSTIKDVESNLRAALERARNQTASNGR